MKRCAIGTFVSALLLAGSAWANLAHKNDAASLAARHWAFQPVARPAVPAMKPSFRTQNAIDAFVLAKLEQKGFTPAPRAEARALVRRVHYDLLGLPPSPAVVEAFLIDDSPEAYARLVDQLLASPHYGERWGRYWLDVARYADTKGYLAGGEERRFPFSHTYRDYVVAAFNMDKPYDRFLVEQIAADHLELGEDKSALAALGFLTLGRRFLNNQQDIIDDRIDVVMRGTQALTVSCARCHDHKFDPISARDYYALHGIFASSEEPAEKPLLGPLKRSPDYEDYLKQIARIEKEIEAFKEKEIAKFIAELRQDVGAYLLGAHEAGRFKDSTQFDTFAGERKLNPSVLRRWQTTLAEWRTRSEPIFGPWFALAAIPGAEFTNQAPAVMASWKETRSLVNPVIAKALADSAPKTLQEAAAVYTRVFKEVESAWQAVVERAAPAKAPPPLELPDPDREALRRVLYAEGMPIVLPPAEARQILARRLGEGSAPLRNQIEALNWTHPGAPARAMALVDKAQPQNSRLLIRGNPGNPGAEVPRRFLEALAGADRPTWTNGSGRLELARTIASRTNPLTARVYVNWTWTHLFGRGFTSTPGDFGLRTEAPLHAELLDYLAQWFMAQDWSPKQLHRLILNSATYQQSSEGTPAQNATDPDNRWLGHQNRRRLDFEALRDTLLAVSGQLDLNMGGLPVELTTEPFSRRRTLYGFIDRQNLPGLFRTFDFANPDVTTAQRFLTTVPQQALFLMNSPLVVEQSRRLAGREEVQHAITAAGKITACYRLALQRPPSREELALGEEFLSARGAAQGFEGLTPVEQYAQVLLLSNELAFVD